MGVGPGGALSFWSLNRLIGCGIVASVAVFSIWVCDLNEGDCSVLETIPHCLGAVLTVFWYLHPDRGLRIEVFLVPIELF